MRRYIILVLIAGLSFAVDRVTKILVEKKIPLGGQIEILPVLNLTHVQNRGGIFGVFAEVKSKAKNITLNFLSIAAFAFLAFLSTRMKGTEFYVVGAMLGGALGNIYGRLTKGFVVDFIDMHIGRYHWPSYNFADAVITVGIIWLIIRWKG